MRLKLITYGGAAFIALLGAFIALTIVQDASANCRKNPNRPGCPQPTPPPPPAPPPPASPPPAPTCDHSVAAGKDGQEGNDDCATTSSPPPPPPPVLNCPAGTSEMGRSGGQVLCLQTTREVITIEKPVIKTRTVVKWKTRVKVKRIVMWKTRTIHHFCPVPGNG